MKVVYVVEKNKANFLASGNKVKFRQKFIPVMASKENLENIIS